MDMCAFSKRSELYCGLFNDCLLTVCFSLFLCFLVRVRCRRKKFTFAISSAGEFLIIYGDIGRGSPQAIAMKLGTPSR